MLGTSLCLSVSSSTTRWGPCSLRESCAKERGLKRTNVLFASQNELTLLLVHVFLRRECSACGIGSQRHTPPGWVLDLSWPPPSLDWVLHKSQAMKTCNQSDVGWFFEHLYGTCHNPWRVWLHLSASGPRAVSARTKCSPVHLPGSCLHLFTLRGTELTDCPLCCQGVTSELTAGEAPPPGQFHL